MQQEEPGEPELGDERELLVEPCGRLGAQAMPGRVAVLETPAAGAGERPVGARILGARIAVAEIVREVEGQRLGEPGALGDRLGMVLEARRHRRRRRQHVGVVAAAQRLGGIERRVLAHRDERVLQASAHRRVRVDVPGRHARDAEAGGQGCQAAVQCAIVPGERALELDPEGVGAERREQAAHRRLVAHPPAGAAAEADEPFGVRRDLGEREGRLGALTPAGPLARACVGARQQPAEVRPAARVAHEQGEMAMLGVLGGGLAVAEAHLGALDRPQPDRAGRLGELHRARDRVVIGQRERRVAALDRRLRELVGQRCPVEEREGRMAVELDVGHERMFASGPDGG